MFNSNKIIIILFALLALLLSVVLIWASNKKHQATDKNLRRQAEYSPDKIVVKFKGRRSLSKSASSTGIASVDALFAQFGMSEMQPILKASTIKKPINRRVAIENIYNVKIDGVFDPKIVAQRLSQDPNIEYAEVKWMHQFYSVPNDPQYNIMTQFAHVQAPAAWDVVKGEQGNVIIGITDSGTDWKHEDLVENIWNNLGEDADGDGRTIEHNGSTWGFDPGDINGIDDDSNGFIDDFIGWNFCANTNDPTTTTNQPHGTHVSGTAAAVTNNGVGVASISWNCKLMPINIAHRTIYNWEEDAYDGIAYAAANGADIVNCSWGRVGPPSRFEQDIIDFAYYNSSLIVVAAGNGGPDGIADDIDIFPDYPTNYKHVLAVGATNRSNDVKAGYSNYGVTVDVFAPGSYINSTDINNQYSGNSLHGTSMSSPMVAGLAGLVKTLKPTYTVDQLREQVRVTCDPIDYLNPALAGKLGKGRINALRAVTDFTIPAIRIDSVSFIDSGEDSIINAGETVDITIEFINYLAAATNVNIVLSVEDTNVTVLNGSAFLGSMNSNEIKSANFQIEVGQNVHTGYILRFYLDISDGSYSDSDFFKLMVKPPSSLNHNTGMVQTSITDRGNIGYVYEIGSPGLGFVHNGNNYLKRAGLLIATDEDHISDCIGGENNSEEHEHDFRPAAGEQLTIDHPGQHAYEEGSIVLVDSLADNPIGITIRQKSFADNRVEYQNFVIFKYTIINNNSTQISNLHAGLAFDWDIRADNCDFGRYDASRKMGYVMNNASNPTKIAATKLLTSNSNVSYNTFVEIYFFNNGFTNQEKWQFLSGGIQTTSLNNTDVFTLLGEGPFTIAVGDSIEVAFAVLGANSLLELQTSADSAQAFYDNPPPVSIESPKKQLLNDFHLFQNYPNPFNPKTIINYELPITNYVDLSIYNILGQKVATLVSQKQPAGTYKVQWDASAFTSGMYFIHLESGKFVKVRKCLLIK